MSSGAVAGAVVAPDEDGEPSFGENADADAIKSHLQGFVDNGTINKWAIPQGVDFVEDIPKTSVGKVNKKLIRDQLS